MARGVPTVMLPRTLRPSVPLRLREAIDDALLDEPVEWRKLFVGGPFDAGLAARKFEEWGS